MAANGWKRLGFVLAGLMGLVSLLAACSSGDDDTDDEDADTAELESAEAADPNDAESDGGEGTETEADEVEDVPVEPIFVAEYPTELGLRGAGFRVQDVIGNDEGVFRVVGHVVDPEARTSEVHIVTLEDGQSTGDVTLPTGGSPATVDAAVEFEGTITAAGNLRNGTDVQPVVWAGSGESFEITDLPVDEAVDGWVSEVAHDGTAVSGVLVDGGLEQAVVWINEANSWTAYKLPTPAGAPEGYASDVMAVEGGYLVSGWGFASIGSSRWPTIWSVVNGVVESYPFDIGVDSMTVTGITEGPNGSILVVGDQIQNESEAYMFTADEPAGPWRRISLNVDSGDRFSSRGYGLAGVDGRGDTLVTWTKGSFIRSVLSSNDGGASWSQRGNLSEARPSAVTTQGIGIGDGTLLAGGYHDLFEWTGDAPSWAAVKDSALPTHTSQLIDPRVIYDNGRFLVAGEHRELAKGRHTPGNIRIYTSEGGEWAGQSVDQPREKNPSQFVVVDGEPVLVGRGATTSDDPLPLWRYTNERWVASFYSQLDSIRSLPLWSIGLDNGQVVTFSNEVETSDTNIVPRRLTVGTRTADIGSFEPSSLSTDVRSIECFERVGTRSMAVLGLAAGDTIVLSDDNLTYREVDGSTDTLAGLDVIDCKYQGDQLYVAVEREGETEEILILDSEMVEVDRQAFPGGANIRTLASLGDNIVVLGTVRDDVDGGLVAWHDGTEWTSMSLEESGIEADGVGRWASTRDIFLLPDEVVISADDALGQVFWRADRKAFFEATGLVDDGSIDG